MKSTFTIAAAVLLSASVYAQKNVTTGGQKYVLVEESTGMWCGYCPDGAKAVESILASEPKAIAVAIHDNNDATPGNPNLNDMMEITDGYTYTHTTGYCNGYPNGSVDRVPSGGKVGMSRTAWAGAVTSRKAASPKFDISMAQSWVEATKTMTITLTVKALEAVTGSYNTNVYITEDKIASNGSGYGQHSYFFKDNTSPYYHKGVPNSDSSVATLGTADYAHEHVLRAMLGSTFGTTGVITVNPASGTTFTKTYTYVLPTGQVPANMHVVGLVQKNNASDVNDREIVNSVQAAFWNHATGINEVAGNLNEVQLYPNPAANTVTVRAMLNTPAETKVTITNSVGQTVFAQSYKAAGSMFSEQISTENLVNGVYFLNIASEGTSTTQKLVVSK